MPNPFASNPDSPLFSLGTSRFWKDAGTFVADEALRQALWFAATLRKPLLLTGEPGTGKTTAAYWAAGAWAATDQRPLHEDDILHYQVRSTSVSQELKYDFDTIRRFYDAQTQKPREAIHYVNRGVLYRAFANEGRGARPVVVLIDEIDKAPRDLPNDLLLELDKQEFEVPEVRDEQDRPRVVRGSTANPLLIVITSNGDRDLPKPFLRRCLKHELKLTEQTIKAAHARRFGGAGSEKLEQYLAVIAKVGERVGPRSLTEQLNWLTMLQSQDWSGVDPGALAKLPFLELLVPADEQRAAIRPTIAQASTSTSPTVS